MKLIELLRAKSEREGEEGENIPLKGHIIETLERAKQLKEFVEINGDTITHPLLKDEKFFTALAIALILHDLGKISYDFQRRVYSKESDGWKTLEDFLKPLRGINVRHEILSSVWASILLNDRDEKYKNWKDWFSKIRTAILLHHYNEYYIRGKDLMEIIQDYFENVREYVKFIVNNWQEFEGFLSDLLSSLHEKFTEDDFIESAIGIIRDCFRLDRAKSLLEMIENQEDDISEFAEFYPIDNENPDYNFLVFLGCLRRCDYSASGSVDLEKTDKDKSGKAIKLEDIYRDLDKSIKEKIGVKSMWQEELLKKAESLKSTVLVAPTGSGKTEFALLWNAKNARKLIYTLPLRVALNDLFWRFKNNYFGDVVNILHSTAFIEYLEEEQKGKKLDVEKQLTASKLLSSPVLLTTPDQVFLTSLNYYGSDKILAVYPLSSVVVDEIQTYDPEMASIIIKTLQIVQKLGGAVLVMTATLPPYFEPFLFEDVRDNGEYNIPKNCRLKFEKIDTEQIKDYVKNYNLKRHKIDVVEDWLTEYVKENDKYSIKVNKELLREYIEKYEEENKNTFIILNNVSKAIEVYSELKDEYPNVFLLHSRLIEKEKDRRIRLIKLILEAKKERENKNKEKISEEIEKLKQDLENININKPVIVVATQIIEASVDLDFDAMITEVSPIDSQVQRWGRIYRNDRDEDYKDDTPNIVIFVGRPEDGEIKIDRGTKAIYDKRVVEKTIEVLKDVKGKILNYSDEKVIISRIFSSVVEVENPDIVKRTGSSASLKRIYVEEIKRNLEFLKYFSVEKKSQAQRLFRRIAGYPVIVLPLMKKSEEDWVKKLAELLGDPENGSKSWKELEELLHKNRWEIKKELYGYSVNVPVFYFSDIMNRVREFKGFYLLEVSEEDAEIIYRYGLDKYMKEKCKSGDEEDMLEELI